MVELLSAEKFKDKKQDYSPFLVHLTKDKKSDSGITLAKDILYNIIKTKELKAFNHFCFFNPALESSPFQDKFNAVCFTETPISNIEILTANVIGKSLKLEPYGLVFTKDFIREMGGNPVFYASSDIAKLFWELYNALPKSNTDSKKICKLLALVTVCEKYNDWHWEREWRIIGDLNFTYSDIKFGLCPEEDIPYFKNNFPQVTFISPAWRINKIINALLEK
ncbi:MAG TPA: hypothetical protein DCR95_12070 [Desulfobacter sp.]|nr:hypothetical protein [Desulfobacter sp.]